MSISDHIFFRTGLAPATVAKRIADALGLILDEDPREEPTVASQLADGRLIGGWVSTNYLGQEPGEPSLLDSFDVVWQLRGHHIEEEAVHAESSRLFALAIDRLPWPTLLLRNLAWAVAVWEPGRGRYDFPERTAPDRSGRDIWQAYVPL